MTKKVMALSSMASILGILVLVAFLTLPTEVYAGAKAVPIEGISYNVTISLTDNLKSFVGKRVSVTLASGSTFTGFVKEVGEHLVHLEKLDGKDFFELMADLDVVDEVGRGGFAMLAVAVVKDVEAAGPG